MDDLKYWVWLSRIECLGSKKKVKILEKYKTPAKIWKLEKHDLLSIEGIGEKIADEILDKKYRNGLDDIINIMNKENIKLINFFDEMYPQNLKQLYDMPISLYVKGNKKLLKEFSLGIIGCRECSAYGEKVADAIGKGLARKSIVTVSGLARGIDSISQRATIKEKGKTIAVIGSGIDIIYPPGNTKLAQDIIENGGTIVTEYPPNTEPKKMHFPARNRIISGLSSGIIVVEAKNKSGTMTTVDFALEQGKTVFAVPRKYNK